MISAVSGLSTEEEGKQPALTDRPFLVAEEEAAVCAVGVGHADVIPICPVQLPDGWTEKITV